MPGNRHSYRDLTKERVNLLKAVAQKAVRGDHWLFMSWYRERFGFLPAMASYITLRKNGIGSAPNPLTGGVVYLRPGTADQNVYEEIFGAREYDIDLGDPIFIVDAGAHVGLSSVFFASKYPKATVIAIEPEPSNFEVLLRNVEQYSNIKPMWAGLWSRKTHLRIQNSDVATWSFRVSEDPSGNGIPAFGVEDLITDFNVKRIDVLKIDIEGSELEVLNNSKPWIDAVRALIIELHDRFQPGCAEALQKAFSGHVYDRTQSAESIVMTNIKRIAT
jgi:FkbM family methyltransferase